MQRLDSFPTALREYEFVSAEPSPSAVTTDPAGRLKATGVDVRGFPWIRPLAGDYAYNFTKVEGLYAGWIQVLRNARGIYLLVRRRTGEQYVGSASGSDGFYGRWLTYQDGHGGNLGMRQLAVAASEYDVNILEVAASNTTVDEIYARENMWKTKLGTRVVGLNRN